MKTETALKKILASDATLSLKISKLQTLALRAYPSSPSQKAVIAAYQELQKEADEPWDTDGDTSKWNENGEAGEAENDRYASRANPGDDIEF